MALRQNRFVGTQRVKVASGLFACAVGVTLLTGAGSSSASAATGTGNTTANAAVASSITLSGLTNAFTLSGAPNTTATTAVPVTMRVTTNNAPGYAVTVQATAAAMTPATVGNNDTIASSALEVRETGTTGYAPLSALTPVTVHNQTGKSIAAGDVINNDYRMVVPFVNADTYSVTLTYVATTK
jgi:large repetitive protein